MDKTASQKYLTQQVMSATPAMLVAMLFDRAIALLGEAIGAIESGQIERRWRANKKATEIVCHLWETLDFEQGGEIATQLSSLYAFAVKRLLAVDVENSAAAAREVIELLEPLRRSWHELARQRENGQTRTPAAQPAPAPNARVHETDTELARITVSA